MFSLTYRERIVLLIAAGIIFCGAIVCYFQVNTKVTAAATFASSASQPAATIINMNKASQED
ncbi:MAG: hypothetical protein PHQ96_04890, partial [Candidatus Omnitrophica bacterium]|nr:hypothetical protein [Candidatus Omnitrophota bacterium]